MAVIAAVVLTTGARPPRPQTAPSTAVLAVKLTLGVALILLAVRQRRRMGRPRKPPGWMASLDRLSLWSAAGVAVFLQPWTLVAAGAATVTQAKLSTAGDYVTLILFCLLGTSSFLYPGAVRGLRSPPLLASGWTGCVSGSTRTGIR